MKCNICSREIPDDSDFCQYCGNKVEITLNTNVDEKLQGKLRRWKIIAIVTIVLCLGSIGAAGFIGFTYYKEKEAISAALAEFENDTTIDDLSKEIEVLQKENIRLTNLNKYLKESKEEEESKASDWERKYWNVKGQASFLMDYIVIVGTDQTYYHKYGCMYLDDSTFWAYNKENAIANGYVPCSHCM